MKIIYYILFFVSLNSFSQNDCAKVDMNYSGYCFEYYPKGKTKWIKEFQVGQAVGIWMYFDEKGNLVKQLNIRLKLDSLNKIYEETFHIDLNDTMIYTFVEEEAKFKGEMLEFISKNLSGPIDLSELGYFPRIVVSFIVEKDGQIKNVEIIKKSPQCLSCEIEVIKMIHKMPKWKPAITGGKIVRSRIQLPINIELH